MAIYAIGDVQGCYSELQVLLQTLKFDASRDKLWFTGDLVNRGPNSLDVLRFVKSLGDSAVSVLGNHDLHLIAVAYGYASEKKEDTLSPLLSAPDRFELLDWLRHRPLLHFDSELNITLIHAGFAPQWTHEQARECANEVETVLQGAKFTKYLKRMYGNKPELWKENLTGGERQRFITNCFTRLRYVNEAGALCLKAKSTPGKQPHGFVPWFRHPARKSREGRIIFGHWSTLGFHLEKNVICLDTGCLWGGKLTALRVDVPIDAEPVPVHVPCTQYQSPGL